MKKCFAAILLGVLVFGARGALAATYYVSNSGSDSYDGTEQAHTTGITGPWQTIAKVNASTFQPGDQVLFQCGGVWREQLTIPSSGSAGGPITFGSYGVGAMPVINGAVSVTGWNNSWVGNLAVSQALSSGPITGSEAYRYTINANSFANSGTTVTITLVSSSSGSTTVAGAYIGQKAASGDAWAFQSTPAQFTFSGSTTVTIPANGSVTSDPLTFTYTAANAYIVSIGYSSYSVNWGNGVNYGTSYGKASDYANAGALDPAGYSNVGWSWHGLSAVTLVGAGPSSQTNTWEANIPAQVYRVNFDGTPGTLVSALSSVTSPGNFYWNGGQLFVYGTANPGTLYSDIEASQLSYGIVDASAQNYITLNGLHVTNANLRGISNSGSNWVIQSCLVDYSGGGPSGYSHGIFLGGSNSVVKNCTLNQINKWGVSVTGNNNLIENNTMAGCWDGKTYAQSGAGSGITTQGVGNTAYANFISGSYHCIDDVGGSQDSTWDYNLCVTWGTNGLDHESGVSGHPARIYNNTVIHTDGAGWGSGHGIVCQTNGNYADIRNNIVVVNGTQTNVNYEAIAISADSFTGITLNNNDYYLAPGTTGMIGEWGSSQYPTLSAWQAAVNGLVTGNDAQSISVDPRLSNTTWLQPADFALQSNSPAVNAGVHLGLTNDFFGNPIEGAPDLGAIEYQFMANPGSLWW